MKVLFLNDSTSSANWGDRAAAVALMAMVKSVGGDIIAAVTEHELKATSFLQVSNDVLPTLDRSGVKEALRQLVPPIVIDLRRRIAGAGLASRRNRLIPRTWGDFAEAANLVLRRPSPWAELWDAVRQCDVVVIHGDGCMVGNGIHPRTILFLAYLTKLHFDRPVILLNHTADFDHPDLHEMAVGVYPLLDDVTFRDSTSRDRCSSFCDGTFVADSAFWFQPIDRETLTAVARRPTYFDVWPDRAPFDPSHPYICIGGSSLFGGGRATAETGAEFERLVRHLQGAYSGQIVLTVSDPVDEVVMRPVAAALRLPLIGATIPVQQAVDILGNADAYIGGRWHPSIFALRGGAPVIPLSAKTFKMQALTHAAGLPATPVDAFHVGREREAIGDQLRTVLDQGDRLRSKLLAWSSEEAARSWQNVRFLRQRADT